MFDEYKATHGGQGPLQRIGQGLAENINPFANIVHANALRKQWAETFDAISKDEDLSPEFRSRAAVLSKGHPPLSQAVGIMGGVMQAAQDQKDTVANVRGLSAQLDRFEQGAGAADLPQIDAMRTRLDLARRLSLSTNPELAKQGTTELLGITGAMQKYATDNETQKIAADTAEAAAARDLDKEQYSRWKDIRENFQKDSLPYTVSASSFNTLKQIASLKNPTANTDQALTIAAGHIFSPDIAVRPGQDPGDAYWNAVPMGLGQAAKYVVTGGTMYTPEERATLVYAATQRMATENENQSKRNTQALDAATAAGLPDAYRNQLGIAPVDVGELGRKPEPGTEPKPPPPPPGNAPPDPHPETTQADTPAYSAGAALVDVFKTGGSGAVDFIRGMVGAKPKGARPIIQLPRTDLPEDDFGTYTDPASKRTAGVVNGVYVPGAFR